MPNVTTANSTVALTGPSQTERPSRDVDQAIVKVVANSAGPIKARQIVDQLDLDPSIPFHEVIRSIWRQADRGTLRVHASQGVTLGDR